MLDKILVKSLQSFLLIGDWSSYAKRLARTEKLNLPVENWVDGVYARDGRRWSERVK